MGKRSTISKLNWENLHRVGGRYRALPSYLWHRSVLRRKIDGPPIFVVGSPHSGTTLLLAILGSHPKIYAVPYESRVFRRDDRPRYEKAVRYFERSAIAAGKTRWVEKTPAHVLHIDRILEWQPDAKIVLMLRDGRDVVYSLKMRYGDLQRSVNIWCERHLAAKPYWQHPSVYAVKYEDLVDDFEGTIAGLMAFLGEDYVPDMKDYHVRKKRWYAGNISKPSSPYGKRTHNRYRNWQINQPLFDGRGKYREMSAEELALVYELAGPMLAELGYHDKNDDDRGEAPGPPVT